MSFMDARIKRELSGILNWTLTGLYRLRENQAFTVPMAAENIKANYKRMTSPISAFMEDCCEVGPLCESGCSDVYEAFCAWAADNGHALMAKALLGEKLRATNPAISSGRKGEAEGRYRFYRGVQLNGDGLAYSDEWRAKKGAKTR